MAEKNMRNGTASLQQPLPEVNGPEWPMKTLPEIKVPQLLGDQSWPKISIVTPSYNQGAYLEKTIRSILLQGYPNLEYIIIDGGSTDQSVDIIRKYEPWIDFWVSEKDRGQSHAINKGLSKTSGELLGWLNSDDWFTEGALFKSGLAYLEDPTVGAVYGQGHITDESGEIIYTPKLASVTKHNLFGWCFGNDFMQPSCLFTRKAWIECGEIDESLNFVLDVEFWIRIAEKFPFKKIPDVLSVSLSHPLAKTTSMRGRSHAELALICMRYGEEAAAKRIIDHVIDEHEETKKNLERFDSMSFFQVIRLAFNKLRRQRN